MPKRQDIESILILGAGPIIIGQACEFDYSGTQACRALEQEGYRVILVNSNPATIMTDPDIANSIYIEPVQWQSVEKDFSLAVVRDVSYLNWRYVANPMGNYRIFSVEEDANFRGFMVLSLRDVKLGGAIAILELLVKPGDKEAGLALLKTAELIGEQIGASRIYCWMLPSHNFYMQLLKQSGFMFRPFGGRVSFLSSVTPFIIRTHSEEDWRKIEPIQLANWFVSMGDHDYY